MELLAYLILSILSAGIIYHLRIREKCIYAVKLTKVSVIILVIISLVLIWMLNYIGDKSWYKYPISIVAIIFIISGVLGQGISERGIYYRPLGAGGHIIRLAKWEDIKDVKIDSSNNKLKSFKLKTETMFPDQIYDSKDIDEINKYVKIKINRI